MTHSNLLIFVHCFRTKNSQGHRNPKPEFTYTIKIPTCYYCLRWNQYESSNTTLNCVCKEPPQTIKKKSISLADHLAAISYIYIIQTGSDSNLPLNAMKMQSTYVLTYCPNCCNHRALIICELWSGICFACELKPLY